MGICLKGGTVVNADQSFKADVYCENGVIQAVGASLDLPAGTEVIDVSGAYVMPGGLDPHTHMQLPSMGTVSSDDYFTGTAAAAAGGTTMIIDYVVPDKSAPMTPAYQTWREWAEKSAVDYSFHINVTSWSDSIAEEMARLTEEEGVNTYKFFLSAKGALMLPDEKLLPAFVHCRKIGAMPEVHAENGDVVDYMQKKLCAEGVTAPIGHPMSRPPIVEGEATNRAIMLASMAGCPIYIVHMSCRDAVEAVRRAQANGIRVYGETVPGYLVVDDSVYASPDFTFAAAHVLSPPFRAKENQEPLWNALTSQTISVVATDHCPFKNEQKRAGKGDFTKIPNGCGTVENRLDILWHFGVNSKRLTPNEFVALTSANAARIFNIYPKKGCIGAGSDADIVVWDPKKEKTISAKTHHMNVDANIFEGITVRGCAVYTLSRGRIVYNNGRLQAEKGAGRYVKRPKYTA